MKKIKFYLTILFSIAFSRFLFSQAMCKVLMPEISDSYIGKCKKGLANGKGTAMGTDRYEGMFHKGLPNGKGRYTWSNGATYEGGWLAGERNGKGVYIVRINGRDSITEGIWKANEYIGPVPEKPEVLGCVGVERYRFSKQGGEDKVVIDIYMSGIPNTTIEDLTLMGSSGNEIKLGRSVGYDNVSFPFVCKVSYTTYNKMQTAKHYVRFEFKISEPGDWLVYIQN